MSARGVLKKSSGAPISLPKPPPRPLKWNERIARLFGPSPTEASIREAEQTAQENARLSDDKTRPCVRTNDCTRQTDKDETSYRCIYGRCVLQPRTSPQVSPREHRLRYREEVKVKYYNPDPEHTSDEETDELGARALGS